MKKFFAIMMALVMLMTMLLSGIAMADEKS